jgi:Phytochelatin synthase
MFSSWIIYTVFGLPLLGPWRWFDESMLDCCEPLEKVKAEGITFGKVACLAHCAGAKVEAYRANQSSLDDFRKHVIKCTMSEDCHVIASYHRSPFKQVRSFLYSCYFPLFFFFCFQRSLCIFNLILLSFYQLRFMKG